MSDTRNGPLLWESLLGIVGEHWLPVVAGGAVRDYWLSQPPKDIDIFVPANSAEDFASIIDSLDSKVCHGRIIELSSDGSCSSEYMAGEEQECIGVWEGEIIGLPVNIVGRRSYAKSEDVMDLIKTFDFGINQVAYRTFGGMASTRAFRNDRIHRMWTLQHGRTYHQSLARYDKVNERHGFPYTLCIPAPLMPMEFS